MKYESLKSFTGGVKDATNHHNEVIEAVKENGATAKAAKAEVDGYVDVIITGNFNGVRGFCIVKAKQAPQELTEDA